MARNLGLNMRHARGRPAARRPTYRAAPGAEGAARGVRLSPFRPWWASIWTRGGFRHPPGPPCRRQPGPRRVLLLRPRHLRAQRGGRPPRAEFKQALGSFLDLVVISLAGGAGVESALRDAAGIGRAGHTPSCTTRSTSRRSPARRRGRRSPASATRSASPSSSSSRPASRSPAPRGHASASRWRSRRRRCATTPSPRPRPRPQATTEKMALPVVLLFLGFLILIGYPAVDLILDRPLDHIHRRRHPTMLGPHSCC